MNFNLISIILSAISILVLIILIIIFIIERKGNKKENSKQQDNSGFIQFSGVILEEIRQQNEKLSKYNEDNAIKIEKNKSDLEKLMSDKFISFKEEVRTNFDNVNLKVENKFDEVNRKVSESLEKGFKSSNDSLIKVNEAVGKMTEATKNIDALNNQVVSLNNVLNNSQTRGRFGEIQLETILSSVFGEANGIYDLQYTIPEYKDRRPDAVLHIPFEEGNLLLCIDSKFSFVGYEELFKKDSKYLDGPEITALKQVLIKQINKISSDYIIKGITYSYALMFIPNDSIYLFLQNNDVLYSDVIDYARKKDVIIVSPSTLQPILSNIKTLKINVELSKNIKEVIKNVEKIKEESKTLKERYEKVDANINALVNNNDKLRITVNKIENTSTNIIDFSIKKDLIDESDLKVINNKNSDE